jgi:hypothetical protein
MMTGFMVLMLYAFETQRFVLAAGCFEAFQLASTAWQVVLQSL